MTLETSFQSVVLIILSSACIKDTGYSGCEAGNTELVFEDYKTSRGMQVCN